MAGPHDLVIAGGNGGHFERVTRRTGRGKFKGREEALRAIDDWVQVDKQATPLFVTGRPGAGKSAVVGEAALRIKHARCVGGIAFHAHNQTADDFASVVKAVLELPRTPASAGQWLDMADHLRSQPFKRVAVLVDAIDEAYPPDRVAIGRILRALATVPYIRVVVAGRRAQRWVAGTKVAESALVNLDTDRFFEREDVEDYVSSLLKAPNRDIVRGLASRADRNFLVAQLLASAYEAAPETVDALDVGPVELPDAFDAFMESLDHESGGISQTKARALLTGLAYARGDGVSGDLCRLFVSTVPPLSDHAVSVEEAINSRIEDYVTREGPPRAPVWRIYHEAIAAALRAHALSNQFTETDVQQRLVSALVRRAKERPLDELDEYTRRQLPWHAAEAEESGWSELENATDILDRLDAGAVGAAGFSAVVNGGQLPENVRGVVVTHHLADTAEPAARVGLRQLGMARAARRSQFDTPPGIDTWTLRWAHLEQQPVYLSLKTSDRVCALVSITLPAGDTYVVAGSVDGSARAWNLSRADLAPFELAPPEQITERCGIRSVAGWADDDDAVVVLVDTASVGRQWRVEAAEVALLSEWEGKAVQAIAACGIGGDARVVSVDRENMLRWWRPATSGLKEWRPPTAVAEQVRALTAFIVDGDCCAATGSDDAVTVWCGPAKRPLAPRHRDWVTSLSSFVSREVGRVVSASRDGTVCIWSADGTAPHQVFSWTDSHARAVAATTAGGQAWIVGGDGEGHVRVWSSGRPEPVSEFRTRGSTVDAVAAWTARGRPLVATAGDEPLIRVWGDLPTVRQAGADISTSALSAWPIAAATSVLTGDSDGHVRVRDSDSGEIVYVLGEEGLSAVRVLSVFEVGGGACMLAVGRESGSVELWEPSRDGVPGTAAPLHEHAIAKPVRSIISFEQDGRCYIASGGEDGRVIISGLGDGDAGLPNTLEFGDRAIRSVAAFRGVDGETTLAVAGPSRDVDLRVNRGDGWLAADGLVGHTNFTIAASAFRMSQDGEWLLATSDDDGTVCLWEQLDGTPRHRRTFYVESVWTLCAYPGPDVATSVVAGCRDGTIRFVDVRTGDENRCINVGEPVNHVAVGPAGSLLVATTDGCLALNI